MYVVPSSVLLNTGIILSRELRLLVLAPFFMAEHGSEFGESPLDPLPVGWRPVPPRSGDELISNFFRRCLRSQPDSRARTEKGTSNYFASRSLSALEQHRKDNIVLGIDKLPGPHEREGGSKRVKLVTEAYYLGEQSFFLHPAEMLGKHSARMNGVAVRSASQRAQLRSAGYAEIDVTFAPPSHPDVTNVHKVPDEWTSLCDSVRQIVALLETAGDELSIDDLRFRIREQLENFPQSLFESNSETPSEPHREAGGAIVEVPSSINVASIKTVRQLLEFVEADLTGLLHWGGASHSSVRKEKWGGKFETENRKLNQLLSSYCYVKFISMSHDDELGSKQELGQKAQATIKRNDKKLELFNEALASLYADVLKIGGWHGVAVKLQIPSSVA
jgi:hypothetical protein